MEAAIFSFFSALEQTFAYLWQHVVRLEGDTLIDLWASMVEQIQLNQSGRVLWFLIAALFVSGTIFLLCVSMVVFEAVAIVNPKKQRAKPIGTVALDQVLEGTQTSRDIFQDNINKTISWAKDNAPRNVIEKLKSGEIESAEKALFVELKKNPKDVGLIMYLLACRALQSNPRSYDALVKIIFPLGLDADTEVCRHAAELGRLLTPGKYPTSEIPPPETTFEVEAELIGDTLGPISEFGSVQTLLDLVRVYFEMGEVDQIRHMIVEVLVCGTTEQRESALKFAKLLINQMKS